MMSNIEKFLESRSMKILLELHIYEKDRCSIDDKVGSRMTSTNIRYF